MQLTLNNWGGVIANINTRTQNHGDEKRGACDVDITGILDIDDAGFLFGDDVAMDALTDLFWQPKGNLPTLDLMFSFAESFDDCLVEIKTPTDGEILSVQGAKVGKFRAKLNAGHTLDIKFQIQTEAVDGDIVGVLFEHLDMSGFVSISQPNHQEQPKLV